MALARSDECARHIWLAWLAPGMAGLTRTCAILGSWDHVGKVGGRKALMLLTLF